MNFFATQSLGRMDVPADLEYPEIDDCYDDRIPFDCKYKNQEQYRSKCIFDVRKSALFLSPKSIQECLILIDDAFGDRDVEYNDGIFNSDRYRNWLTREGTRDNIDSRICFSRNFREELYNRLLTIFKEYTSIHEMT